jgi:hypothetical protein
MPQFLNSTPLLPVSYLGRLTSRNSTALKVEVEVEVEVTLRLGVHSQSFYLGIKPLRLTTRDFFD